MPDQTATDSERKLPVFRWVAVAVAILAFGMIFVPADVYEWALSRDSGQSAELIAGWLPNLFALVAGLAAIMAAVAWCRGRQIDDAITSISRSRLTEPAATTHRSIRKEYIWWALVCFLLVLAFDWRSLIWGYFESDDFQFLIDNRVIDFPKLLFAVMNDHVFPLGRFLIRVLHWSFGANAIAYNALAVGCLVMLVWSGTLFLLQSGVSRLSALLFVLLMVGWTMWGEFTSGEYILLLYESLMIATLFIGWATIRWSESGKLCYSLLVSLLVGYACFMSISGFYVACAAVVFFACELISSWRMTFDPSSRQPTSRVIRHIFAIGIPVALASIMYVYVYRSPSGPTFLSSAGERSGLSGLAIQWCYTIATALLSIPLAIPHHLVDFGLMRIAMVVSLLMFVAFAVAAWPHIRRDTLQMRFISVLLVIGGVTLMICLGRPTQGLGNVVPPKYLFMPYTLLCIALAIAFDGWSCRTAIVLRPRLLKFSLVGILVIWSLQGAASFLGGRGMPFFETTRGGELRAHRRVYAATEELREAIFAPMEAVSHGRLSIPDISGESLCQQYPGLRFPWGYEPQMGYMLDVLAENPRDCQLLSTSATPLPWIEVTKNLREAVSPEFIDMLKRSERLRKFYSLPAKLVADEETTNPQAMPQSLTVINSTMEFSGKESGWELESDGNAQILIQYSEWKPELRHQLNLAVDCPPGRDGRDATVSFSSELFPEAVEHSLPICSTGSSTQTIDLLQLPSFALSENIESLTIHLHRPGVYHVRCCEVRFN